MEIERWRRLSRMGRRANALPAGDEEEEAHDAPGASPPEPGAALVDGQMEKPIVKP
jgi:hypothetical protein